MPKKSTKRKKGKTSGIGSLISDAAKEGSLLIGSNTVFKSLKKGRIKSVIAAKNLPESRKAELDQHASVSGISVESYEGDSSKLGEACGKPFNVLVVGIKK